MRLIALLSWMIEWLNRFSPEKSGASISTEKMTVETIKYNTK